jgi:hypothetical protein
MGRFHSAEAKEPARGTAALKNGNRRFAMYIIAPPVLDDPMRQCDNFSLNRVRFNQGRRRYAELSMSATPDFLDPRPDLTLPVPPSELDATFNDMRDSDAEIDAYAELPLCACRAITKEFETLDCWALRWQFWHKWITRLAASCGTIAVIMAILGLALEKVDYLKPILAGVSGAEIFFALMALAVALIGLAAALKERWLLCRHQAETCRLLKFRFLLQPSRWLDAAEAQARLDDALLKIVNWQVKKAVREAIEAPLPRFSLPLADAVIPRSCLSQLNAYYRSRRLNMQRAYLENRAGQNEAIMWLYTKLPASLFFASVIAAVFHFIFEHYSHSASNGKWDKSILYAGLAAACLPVAATWVRAIRAAFEHSRNKSRFRAASAALAELDHTLMEDMARVVPPAACDSAGIVDARAPMQDMLWCEQILHTEHIEWLRLMVETEWYG